MSWNKHYASLEAFASDERMSDDQAANLTAGGAEQWALARKAAAELIASGVIGEKGKDFQITLSGHANPNHEPAKGWSNDCISISVVQKSL